MKSKLQLIFFENLKKLTNKNKLLMIIIASGFFLRVVNLSKESIWVDEGFTYQLSKLNLISYLENVLHTLRNILPPLYFFSLHYWTMIFGYSEFSLRLPSVLFGTFSIFLIYKVGKKLFNENVGLYASFILALSLFHLKYSQEARMYELLSFLTLAAFYFLLEYIENKRKKSLFLLALLDIFLVYIHHYGFFVIIAQLGCLFASSPKTFFNKRILFFLGGIFLAIVPWLYVLINQIKKVYSDPWLSLPNMLSLGKVFLDFSGSLYLCIFFGLLIGFFLVKNKRKNLAIFSQKKILLIWMLVPIILSLAYSYLVSPIFGAKYLIFSSIPLYILAAKGIDYLRPKFKIASILLIAVFSLIEINSYYKHVQKEQWREATNFLEQEAMNGDLILFNAGFGLKNGFAYYAKRDDLDKRPFPKSSEEVNLPITESNIKELRDYVKKRNRVWIVYSHSLDKEDVIYNELAANYAYVSNTDFAGITIYLFEN